jgi:uncharacterized repeat protein (TIGR03806 family)
MKNSALLFLTLVTIACSQQPKEMVLAEAETTSTHNSLGKEKLSEYGFFSGPLKDLNPAPNVIVYEVNAPLFSDYALKKRFVFVPEGQKITYNHTDVFDFPEGSVLIKNFLFAESSAQEERIIETRLLIRTASGWEALPYIWNKEQTEAYLEPAGGEVNISHQTSEGELLNFDYSIPNQNQCKNCHARGDQLMPVGPTARQLNKEVNGKNQLIQWEQQQILRGIPTSGDFPKLISYENEDASVELRARSWLEANCAHCHRKDGPAKTSGLHLLASETNPLQLGVGKAPVAAGRGSGGLKYDIVPGAPDKSILYHRIVSNDPGVMMPELGRKVVHREGAELISQWIREMK